MENPYDALERIIQTLIDVMGFEGSCSVKEHIDTRSQKTVFHCTVKTPREYSRLLIGQHGANLYAFEHLIRSIAYKKGITQRVHVDINDYKDDKDRMITAIAKDAANQAHREKKPIVLRPMNAYERRIVHTVAGSDERVSSESIGEGLDRKVVIKPQSIMDAL